MSLAEALVAPLREAPSDDDPVWKIILDAKRKPCKDCKNSYHIEAMEFDHCRGEKKFELSRGTKYGTKTVRAEIAKCDLVCANCHRIRTAARRQRK